MRMVRRGRGVEGGERRRQGVEMKGWGRVVSSVGGMEGRYM